VTEYLTLEKFEEEHVNVPVSGESDIHDIELKGCSPIPLAHYLKALGIFRLIAEQKDPGVRGYWKNDIFHVRTKLTYEELLDFFFNLYKPTPVVSPWNGGSGFSPKDNTESIIRIEKNKEGRFELYRNSISMGIKAREIIGVTDKVEKEQKEPILRLCRNSFPDGSLEWLDAAYVLTDSGPRYPPILGTGGNDGRLDFSNNFMKNIVSVLMELNRKESIELLNNSLTGKVINDLSKSAIGQFFPNAAGGANASAGFEGDSKINQWDFIFMIEGALLFASSCTRRHQGSGTNAPSYPFSVRSTASGYGSSTNMDEDSSKSRDELWVPIWTESISLNEVRRVFSEGRSTIGRKISVNGIDFARSIAMLGVDRGIDEFQRYGFQVRNGLAYFATPLGRFKVKRNPDADLVMEIDSWFDRFRYKCTKEDAPASFSRTMNNLDRSILDICKREGPSILQNLLKDLGRCEKAMVTGLTWTLNSNLRPVPPLSQKWLEKADDGSVEFRLAASLASVYGKYGKDFIPIRYNLEPVNRSVVDGKMKSVWWANEGNTQYVKPSGTLAKTLNSIMERRLITASQCNDDEYPDHGTVAANTSDIADFIEGRINDQKMIDLLWGFLLIDWNSVSEPRIVKHSREDGILPGADYSIMKLCYHNWHGSDIEIKLNGQIHRNASRGNGMKALELAIRRLRGSGIVPAVDVFPISRSRSERIAASMLFPISTGSALMLKDNVTRPKNKKEE